MSTYHQEGYVKNTPCTMTTGWDPALHRFFLVIESQESEDEFPLYSNLDDRVLDQHPEKYQDLNYFKKMAEDFGFPISEKNLMAMLVDQHKDN